MMSAGKIGPAVLNVEIRPAVNLPLLMGSADASPGMDPLDETVCEHESLIVVVVV